jgi:hypothetical protein
MSRRANFTFRVLNPDIIRKSNPVDVGTSKPFPGASYGNMSLLLVDALLNAMMVDESELNCPRL